MAGNKIKDLNRVSGNDRPGRCTGRYYLAYGSNLSSEQMAYRCPDAKIVGTAVLEGWKLRFRLHATIEPEEDSKVPVLVWELSEADEKMLDRYEGYPSYYFKKDLEVKVTSIADGKVTDLTAMVYIMTEGRPLATPCIGYYGVLMDGYDDFGFDEQILDDALEEAKAYELSRHGYRRKSQGSVS